MTRLSCGTRDDFDPMTSPEHTNSQSFKIKDDNCSSSQRICRYYLQILILNISTNCCLNHPSCKNWACSRDNILTISANYILVKITK